MKHVDGITDLDGLPLILTLPEMVRLYRIGESTLRRRLQAGTFDPPPWETYPYRWRKQDVIEDLHRKHTLKKRPHGRQAKAQLQFLNAKAG